MIIGQKLCGMMNMINIDYPSWKETELVIINSYYPCMVSDIIILIKSKNAHLQLDFASEPTIKYLR
jgi:hypothetical protein